MCTMIQSIVCDPVVLKPSCTAVELVFTACVDGTGSGLLRFPCLPPPPTCLIKVYAGLSEAQATIGGPFELYMQAL